MSSELVGRSQRPVLRHTSVCRARVASVPTSRSSVSSVSSAEDPVGVHYVKIDASRQLEEEFEFGEILGEGSFGQVLLALRKRDREKFAVKKLAKNKDTKSTYGKSWENEIRVLRRFQHPNIVQLEIIYESENNCYLFMELCDAGTLGDELERRGRFEETDAKCLLRQVGCAVSFLHRSRIVHRDLKLQNCLLKTHRSQAAVTAAAGTPPHSHSATRRSRGGGGFGGGGSRDGLSDSCPFAVKLTDFGLSIELRGIDHALADNVGTPIYQAPEIVSGSSYTFKCDIWAFGILAYTMLHGAPPYSEGISEPADLTDAIKSFDYSTACAECPTCRRLTRECRTCLQRLLQPCQVERWSASEFLESAWATDHTMVESDEDGGGSILKMMRSMNKANSAK